MTIMSISPRGRRVAIALFLSTALSTAVPMTPAFAQSAQSARAAFFNSQYTYCDAKMVGAFWGLSPERGKIEIGSKIVNRIAGNLPRVLAQSRRAGNACSWEDTGLSYSDAELLADIWGLRTPYNAKVKAARHYTMGRSNVVANALGG